MIMFFLVLWTVFGGLMFFLTADNFNQFSKLQQIVAVILTGPLVWFVVFACVLISWCARLILPTLTRVWNWLGKY